MFAFIVQAAPQLAKQVAPYIYVVVQPPPAGMPEWLRLLLSAVVGAVFAIASNLLMEFIKPYIARSDLRDSISEQLLHEIRLNREQLWDLLELLRIAKIRGEASHVRSGRIKSSLEKVSWDRYEFYLLDKKGTIYELDPFNHFPELRELIGKIQAEGDRHQFDDAERTVNQFLNHSDEFINAIRSGQPIKFHSDGYKSKLPEDRNQVV